MSSHLARVAGLTNTAQTCVVLAASNKLTSKPTIPMKDDDHHHDDHHMSLPNKPKASSLTPMGKLLIGGNLKVSNSFTS